MAKTASSGGGSGRGRGPMVFIRESWAELRKVQWPSRQQVASGTLVVGVVTAAIALYITLVDQAASRAILALYERLT